MGQQDRFDHSSLDCASKRKDNTPTVWQITWEEEELRCRGTKKLQSCTRATITRLVDLGDGGETDRGFVRGSHPSFE